jgi:hypothetical protein
LNVVTNTLYRIDKTTGTGTSVGPTGLNYALQPMGMDFDPSDGTLYGCVVVEGPPDVGHLVSFDVVQGTATILATGDEIAECAVQLPASPTAALHPVLLAVDTAGNSVLEPNEGAKVVAPTWRNTGATATVTGTASNFTGPGTATFVLSDGSASYGAIAAGSPSSCTATGDCYSMGVTASARPATHWDAGFDEVVVPGSMTKSWSLHLGDSFSDVPVTNPFYRFVETLLHHSVTGGCAVSAYCPGNATTREQMAVFVLVAKEGSGYAPNPCTSPIFNDVPDTSPFCPWIVELAVRGVVSGCGGGNYCPTAPVTREQMAIFVLRTLDPALAPPACTTPMFGDVPASSPFCPWVEELARRGVVSGCGGGNYCPLGPVTREQMGVFLSVTFGLTLYGP